MKSMAFVDYPYLVLTLMALFIFFVLFVVLVFKVFKTDSQKILKYSQIPFDQGGQP